MNYQTFQPRPDLSSFVKCYWTLEVPAETDAPKQRILPDGCIEMCFILGDDIKRFTSENDFIIQPRQMVLGQITKPYFIQPVGYVNSFAVRFYPYGFANFVSSPIADLANRETPIELLFGEETSGTLSDKIIHADNTQQRIQVIEDFLLARMKSKETISQIAYEREYYDQAHFIKDFREFTGISPRHFLGDVSMQLSALFYAEG